MCDVGFQEHFFTFFASKAKRSCKFMVYLESYVLICFFLIYLHFVYSRYFIHQKAKRFYYYLFIFLLKVGEMKRKGEKKKEECQSNL